jgi:hypothetical protein
LPQSALLDIALSNPSPHRSTDFALKVSKVKLYHLGRAAPQCSLVTAFLFNHSTLSLPISFPCNASHTPQLVESEVETCTDGADTRRRGRCVTRTARRWAGAGTDTGLNKGEHDALCVSFAPRTGRNSGVACGMLK